MRVPSILVAWGAGRRDGSVHSRKFGLRFRGTRRQNPDAVSIGILRRDRRLRWSADRIVAGGAKSLQEAGRVTVPESAGQGDVETANGIADPSADPENVNEIPFLVQPASNAIIRTLHGLHAIAAGGLSSVAANRQCPQFREVATIGQPIELHRCRLSSPRESGAPGHFVSETPTLPISENTEAFRPGHRAVASRDPQGTSDCSGLYRSNRWS